MDEGGFVSREVRSHAPVKKIVEDATSRPKATEAIRRRRDLPSALVATKKPRVNWIKFQREA
jgi:hypothetical protein